MDEQLFNKIEKHAKNISNAAQDLLKGDHKAALEDLGMTEHAKNISNAAQDLLKGDHKAALEDLGMTEHAKNISNAAQDLLKGDHKAALEDLGMTEHAKNISNAAQDLLKGDHKAALEDLGITKHMKNTSNSVEDLWKGLDISHWNNKVDWSRVAKDGIKFSFAKATEGATYQDPWFEQNFKGMKENNVQAGGYHVFRMTSTPDEQIININNTLTKAGFRPSEDKLAISATTAICSQGQTKCDNPTTHNNQQRAENLNDLLTKLNEAGYHPIVFASPKTWNDYYIQGKYDFSEYPLWVAHWTEEKAPLIPKDWKDKGKSYDYWNYSCEGKVEGIDGNVCLDKTPQNAVQNLFNGDHKTAFEDLGVM